MFQSLATLSERDIAAILDAVRDWCRIHQVDIESPEGRSALAVTIDHVQASGSSADLSSFLAEIQDAGFKTVDGSASDRAHFRDPQSAAIAIAFSRSP